MRTDEQHMKSMSDKALAAQAEELQRIIVAAGHKIEQFQVRKQRAVLELTSVLVEQRQRRIEGDHS